VAYLLPPLSTHPIQAFVYHIAVLNCANFLPKPHTLRLWGSAVVVEEGAFVSLVEVKAMACEKAVAFSVCAWQKTMLLQRPEVVQ